MLLTFALLINISCRDYLLFISLAWARQETKQARSNLSIIKITANSIISVVKNYIIIKN